eukprot:s423_g2.t1
MASSDESRVADLVASRVASMEPFDESFLRATPAWQVLRSFGAALRWTNRDLYDRSFPVSVIQVFWSHSWHGSNFMKRLLLLLLYNGPAAAIAASISVLLMSLVFVDQVCINQKDAELKKKGILSIGAFLKYSEQLLLVWDNTYAGRLWCLLELAAFLKSHEQLDEKVTIRLTAMAPCILGAAFALWASMLHFILVSEQAPPDILVLVLTRLFLVYIQASYLRQLYRNAEIMLKQLSDFTVEAAGCHCCNDTETCNARVCDREIITRCLRLWYGSVEAFEVAVRTRVRIVLHRQLGGLLFPYGWQVISASPLFWGFADLIAARGRAGNWKVAAIMLVGTVTWCFFLFPFIFQLTVLLANYCRQQQSHVWMDRLKSLAVAFVSTMLSFAGQWSASLMADVVAVFVWMGVVVILAGASWLALGYQARRAALTWCSIEKDVGERCVAVVAWTSEADDCWNWSCNVQELDESRVSYLDAVDVLLELERARGKRTAEKRVRSIRDRVAFLGSALKTPPPSPGGPPAPGATAEFVVVTRPTELDAAEAERLVRELKSQGICCRRLIVNQLIEEDSGEAYWKARVESQGQVLSELRSVCSSKSLPLYEVGDRPENLVGPPALGYLASLAFGDASALPKTQVTLFGGKGGVGKTSMSSAMAVKTAMDGQRVLIISTDPAHSLGDALGCKLSASAQAVENFAGSGELFAMEVDTAAAMKRFQETVRDALQRRQNDGGIVGQVLKQLPMQDFVDLFDTLPPGSDEIVALTEVLEKVEKENFDRIIIDTAPTGHAVRLLTYPDFLERLAERVARLRERFGWLSGESKGPDQVRSFQFRMIELQELFTDPDRSSFSVVTIPTTLALEETKRLLVQLEEQDIRCGLVIANRILDIEQVGQMAASQQKTQQVALEALESLAKKEGLEVVRVPYLDREVQGIYGLQYLGRNLVEA